MSMVQYARSICRGCARKSAANTTKCVFARRDQCPDYQASLAIKACDWEDAAIQIPTECLLKALRFQGYSGKLEKTMLVSI